MKKNIIFALVLLVLVGGISYWYSWHTSNPLRKCEKYLMKDDDSFYECNKKIGYPYFIDDSDFEESFARLQKQKDEECIKNNCNVPHDAITVDGYLPSGLRVSVPGSITGTAKGWYFEGSFPVRLYDYDGKEISVLLATAQGDWMTSDPVPFKIDITNDDLIAMASSSLKPVYGKLRFEKDNPSGEPQFDDHVEITAIFDF
jgi:hypothetical protein